MSYINTLYHFIYIYDITTNLPLLCYCLHIYNVIMFAFYNNSPYICKIKDNKYEHSPETVSCS